MAKYLVTYLDGDSETIEAANVEPRAGQYVAWTGDGSSSAYIPTANVRSVIRIPEADADA